MERDKFYEIFDKTILPFVEQLEENNPKIRRRDLTECKANIYDEYMTLNRTYKSQIFDKDADTVLLDRHKIAACICGAFLRVPVLDKTELVRHIKKTGQKVEVVFYYVNELVAFYAATKFFSFFMILEHEGQDRVVREILKTFPLMPPTTKNKKGFWNSVLFNLSQIKDEKQIGTEHFDMYAYAMFFFWLENYFYERVAA